MKVINRYNCTAIDNIVRVNFFMLIIINNINFAVGYLNVQKKEAP